MLEKYLNMEGFLEKFLKIKYALKSTEKIIFKGIEKFLSFNIFCRNEHCCFKHIYSRNINLLTYIEDLTLVLVFY